MLKEPGKSLMALIEIVTGMIILAIAAILALQVVTRYLLAYPVSWPEEICGFLFVWVIFLGAVLAHTSGGLMSMTVLRDKLPVRYSVAIQAVMNSVVIACLILLVVKSGQATLLNLTKKTTVLRFSWAYVYAALPFGFALLTASYANALVKNIKDLLKTGKGSMPVQ
jgi:TRAP-type C4-dicarboxylate transport system permease small subunit